MRKMVITLLALGLFAASTAFAANPVRISQVYGGGGGSSVWTYDYVELFNSGGCPAAIGGWSIQYGSSAGTVFGSSATNCAFIPAGGKPSDPLVCPATKAATCRLDGTCDGKGACRLYVEGTECKPGTCDGDSVTGIVACDGNGNCS